MKKKEYFDLVNPKYISWEFYSGYLKKEVPFGQLGVIVFLRTYSRFIEELQRREYWMEVCLRVIEYSLSLDTISSYKWKKKEAEKLFDTMFNLKGFSAGRSLWTAGTKQTEVDPSSGWNCCFRAIDDISSFSEIFYWLMIGAGTGFSVEEKYISKLPVFRDVEISHDEYEELPDYLRDEHSEIEYLNPGELAHQSRYNHVKLNKNSLIVEDIEFNSLISKVKDNPIIFVGDSKEGWCNALRAYLHLISSPDTGHITKIKFNYDNVRPEGTRIKTFGGRSSGHKVLIELFNNIHNIIADSYERLTSVNVLDIVNSIGLGVVSGGVRRTAQISLGDSDDIEFKEAKVDLWTDETKEKYRKTRPMSNNSILNYTKPSFEDIEHTFKCLKSQGDPGFWNIGNANKLAESNIAGTNPCAEAGLDNAQTCNLTTTNVVYCIRENEKGEMYLDFNTLKETIELVTRIGCRQTLANQWHPNWDKMQKRDRLLGVSLTGVQDAFDILNYTDEDKIYFYKLVKDIAIDAANEYHEKLGINKSTRITLLKPEGTISQLPTVSSGIHKAYAPYYLRRVRFSKSDPLSQVLLKIGFKPKPENSQGDDLFAEECNTWVFTFPIMTNSKVRAIDISAEEQLNEYLLAQKYYADRGHNVSFTCTLAPDEYEKAAKWVHENWEDIIGVSFLPRYDPQDENGKAAYPQLPYETCTEEEYCELLNSIPELKEEELITLLQEYEKEYEENELDSDCQSKGFCPVR